MSGHTRKHPTNKLNQSNSMIRMHHAGIVYQFPAKVAEKYRIKEKSSLSVEEIFANINKKYTKPGALLKGIRVRENLTQIEMAKKIKVTQSDISQMEGGVRKIGRAIAKRIEKLFGVSYRSFLE